MCQLYYIEAAGINDIPKHIARTYAGKLIHVTYQNQPGSYVYRSKKGMHKTYIHHGHLINNNDICVQRIFLISVKMHPGRPPLTHSCSMYIRAVAAGYSGRNQLQHTVDRSGLISGSLRHTLGRPSCRGCQKYFHGFHLKVAYDGVDGSGLTRARAAGNHKKAAVNRLVYSSFLKRIQKDCFFLLYLFQVCFDFRLRNISPDI